MKLTLILTALIAAFNVSAQSPVNVEIKGNIFNTSIDSVCISQYFGTHYVDIIKTPLDKKGDFLLKGSLPAKDYYVIRFGNQHINLIMRENSKMAVYADGKNVNAYHTISGSDESIALNNFITQLQVFNAKRDSATAYLQRFPDQQEAVNQSFQNEYNQFTAYRQQFINENPNSAALLPVLSTINPEAEFPLYETVVNQLAVGFSGSPSIESVKQQYLQQKQLKEERDIFAPGKPAPDFTQNDINGNPVTLSSLKGKVVLIDFWASWCGPCRKENPNVVKLYDKYKDQGFTVLSVSLDKDKTAWLAAIEKDNLKWPYHVSDLQQWSNAVARQYQVSGIPYTVLVDQSGNIVNTKLRGPELESTLTRIFGF